MLRPFESENMTIQAPVQNSSLILPSSPSFYHAKIPDKHWQLRSLLCSPESDVLLYPTGQNIYSLNTKTRRRELVASLPFNLSCIGAKYGWACVGGKDNGYFASIRLGDFGKARSSHEDESVGMEMDAEDEPVVRPEVRISALGGSIVNSITLHRPQGSKNDDDVLAILTNNDKTVRVFSLSQNRVQATLHLPISTNHASISPDGKHLVIVGDSTSVYFYHSNLGTSSQCEVGREPWTLTCQLTAGTCDALISTAFSPSSVHCAVASQDGSITIFDTRYLSKSQSTDSPSLNVIHIPSTRPQTYAGAIRSVQFSSAPWDLLVWAEHYGRVTIADARSDFKRRQVIDVLNNSDTIVDVDVVGVSDDVNDAPSCEERLRRGNHEEEGIEEDSSQEDVEGYFRANFMDRDGWMANPTIATTPQYPVSTGPTASPGPTASTGPPPSTGSAASPGYMHPRYYMRNIPSAVISPYNLNPTAGTPHITISTNNNSSTITVGVDPVSPTTSALLRDYREQQLERDRARQRSVRNPSETVTAPPALQNSITHPSNSGHQSATITTEISNAGLNRPIHFRIDYEAQRPPAEEASQLQRNREQLSQMIAEERRRNTLRRTLHSAVASTRRNHGTTGGNTTEGGHESSTRQSCEEGVDITGCTMSVDGSKLYVATDKGIVEYKINLAARRVFPSIQWR